MHFNNSTLIGSLVGKSEKTSKEKTLAVERRDHAKNKTKKCPRIYEYEYLIKEQKNT